MEDDEGLLDQAVVGGAFSFLRRCVQTPHFHEEVCRGNPSKEYLKLNSVLFRRIL